MATHPAAARLLVSAGEASGDRLAAAVVRACGGASVGLGGDALAAAGMDLVAHVRDVAACGLGDAARALPALGAAGARLLGACVRERPRAALLVDFTEFNARLGVWLRRLGVPVLWLVAPQVWAWRPGRLRSLRRSFDRLAVLFRFEEALWRSHGHEAYFVGHPAAELAPLARDEARRALGLSPGAKALALLPGSRPNEIARLLGPMLDAVVCLRRAEPGIEVAILRAPSLSRAYHARIADDASRYGVRVIDVDARVGSTHWLAAFDASICASGTATLEAALAGATPVVTYRVDALSALVARRALRVRDVGLPNVLLGRRAYSELLQDEARPEALAAAALDALASPRNEARRELIASLRPPPGASVGARVASLLERWR